ncbi:unannotated protein [freshwater metagenome]|uniref:Unannotated protein n=1 Tax=freshwater metagenome TaxID=449393 RepID=A0A6J6VQD9_9ZZZZ|nr:DUF4244 domain-containing protein [Nocardioides sp.]MSY86586.1 DUF4244 domain-containing protein [Actinomycetota bacterium]
MHRSITTPLSRLRSRRPLDTGTSAPGQGQPVCDCAEAAARDRAGRPGRHLSAVPEREAGITTAEYAVGTAAGAGLAGLLYTMLSGGFGDQLLTTLFDHVLGLLGVG